MVNSFGYVVQLSEQLYCGAFYVELTKRGSNEKVGWKVCWMKAQKGGASP